MVDVIDLEARAAEYREVQQKPPSALDLIKHFLGGLEVSEEEAEEFNDPEWVYENLVIDGHIHVFAAEPNGGKTTLMWNLSPVFAQNGYSVTYINADISGTDAKAMVGQAKTWGIDLLLPDIKGLGMPYVVQQLRELARVGTRFERQLFIFDTLKKMIPPNNKEGVRELFQMLRTLSAQGMTIVLLAHTNKYYDESTGLPVFEGVGDIRSDTDELIYLIPREDRDGTKIISTVPDKVRGEFKPISFRINSDRSITALEKHQDLRAAKALEKMFEKDRETVELVHDVLGGDAMNQSQITQETGIGKAACIKLLKRYSGKQWSMEIGTKNSRNYRSLLPHMRFPGGENDAE